MMEKNVNDELSVSINRKTNNNVSGKNPEKELNSKIFLCI